VDSVKQPVSTFSFPIGRFLWFVFPPLLIVSAVLGRRSVILAAVIRCTRGSKLRSHLREGARQREIGKIWDGLNVGMTGSGMAMGG